MGKSVRILRKTVPVEGGKTKPAHRYRPGTVALLDVWRFQKATDLLILKKPFGRIVREITQTQQVGLISGDICYQGTALLANQEAAEARLIEMFRDRQLAAIHAKRVTITPKDIKFVTKLKEIIQMHTMTG